MELYKRLPEFGAFSFWGNVVQNDENVDSVDGDLCYLRECFATW